jgi:hypothetical protein
MTLLFLLRHGAIVWPEPDTFIGQTDPPLSVAGRRQALAWRDTIGETGFSAVWSSDLKRCAETAALVFGDGQAQIRFSSGLREITLAAGTASPGAASGKATRTCGRPAAGIWVVSGRRGVKDSAASSSGSCPGWGAWSRRTPARSASLPMPV